MFMKILVTGANGYLGTGVVKQLCYYGMEVVAACHNRTDHVDQRAIIKQGDIFEIEDPYKKFEKSRRSFYIWLGEMGLCIMILHI